MSKIINKDLIPKDVYSIEEVKTNKVWVDDNDKEWPIYRKTFVFGEAILVLVGEWVNIIEISSLNLKGLIDIKLLDRNDLAWTGTLSKIQSNYLQLAGIGRDNTSWYVKTLILEYTKTTD